MLPSRHHNKSPISPILKHLASDLGLVIIVVLVFFAVYLIDTITPLGEPVWLLYFIPLILAYWSTRSYAIPAVCIVTLIFLVCGFFFSLHGVGGKPGGCWPVYVFHCFHRRIACPLDKTRVINHWSGVVTIRIRTRLRSIMGGRSFFIYSPSTVCY